MRTQTHLRLHFNIALFCTSSRRDDVVHRRLLLAQENAERPDESLVAEQVVSSTPQVPISSGNKLEKSWPSDSPVCRNLDFELVRKLVRFSDRRLAAAVAVSA